MLQDRPSLTALRVAMSRAAHQLFDDPKVLDDPVALRLIGSAREQEIRADQRSFFAWLGVSMYLTRAAIMSTLGYVAARPRGSGIVFDYAVARRRRSFLPRLLMRRVAAAGEPWKTLFDPAALAAELRTLGFAQTEDLGPDELNVRFFSGRRDKLRVGRLAHVISART